MLIADNFGCVWHFFWCLLRKILVSWAHFQALLWTSFVGKHCIAYLNPRPPASLLTICLFRKKCKQFIKLMRMNNSYLQEYKLSFRSIYGQRLEWRSNIWHSANCATVNCESCALKETGDGDRRQETGNVGQETWERRRETGNVRQETWDKTCGTGGGRHETG